ncbi:MAG: hypothetical protein C0407_18685 [Desulfobacca sp.]|nr:hypothetical protein [Desulfobacca sp.]
MDHVPVVLGLNSNGLRQPSIFAGENLYKDSTNIILPLFNVRKMKRKVMVTYDDLIRSQEAKTVLGWMKKEAFVDVKDPKKEGIPWASNHIYKDCDRVYTHLQLSSKEPILFYIEGGRSRSGALEEPKAGILYDVMDYVLQSRKKVCFVPIAISYTTVPEDKSIEESRRGKNISEGNLIAQIVKLDYSVKKGAKIYFTVCEPMIVGPEDLAGAHALSDFGYKIMAAIGRGIVNVDTYLLAAALILNQKYTYKTQDALTFMGTISAMVGEETDSNKLEKKLASATKNFLARGFIEKEGDHYRIMNMPLIEQYANRIKHKMPKTLIS